MPMALTSIMPNLKYFEWRYLIGMYVDTTMSALYSSIHGDVLLIEPIRHPFAHTAILKPSEN